MKTDAYNHLVKRGFVPLLDLTWWAPKSKHLTKKDQEALDARGEKLSDDTEKHFKLEHLAMRGE